MPRRYPIKNTIFDSLSIVFEENVLFSKTLTKKMKLTLRIKGVWGLNRTKLE